jgi:predicted porin
MKNACKWAMAAVPTALACHMAHAQSSVTLYGVIDESVHYLTHANQAGDSSIGLGNGGMTESRWGIRGVEDLGGGWSTFFKLENRFYMNTGQSDPTLPFFNEAQVGVRSDSYGQVIFGRQYNAMIEGITIGGYGSNLWIPYDFSFQPEVTMTGGIWTSNQVQYQAKYDGFHLAAIRTAARSAWRSLTHRVVRSPSAARIRTRKIRSTAQPRRRGPSADRTRGT